MTTGMILAGGKATRLGPLAAQLNKSLVSVGSKPQLVRLAQQLDACDTRRALVVTGSGAQEQVDSVISRAGLRNVTTVVQPTPRGPVDAIHYGLSAGEVEGGIIVLMSDTIIETGDIAGVHGTRVFVAPAPVERSFCTWNPNESLWEDRHARLGELVAVGAFAFASAKALRAAVAGVLADATASEHGMASLLNAMGISAADLVLTSSWRDIGDVESLARANRERFISRSFNDIILNENGTITKVGSGVGSEGRTMSDPPHSARHLFPRIYDTGPDWYSMEYVDTPSLAELWLYWPSLPSMWTHVTGQLVGQLQRHLWPHASGDITDRAHEMWWRKLHGRYATHPFGEHDSLIINGSSVTAGLHAIKKMQPLLDHLVMTASAYTGWIHGDPNFTNVMWSLPTGAFKLLDARDSWGGASSAGDIRYDVGKIAYSPIFSAVTHKLFKLDRNEENIGVSLLPQRHFETFAIEQELRRRVPCNIELLKAYFCLSSAPLHDDDECWALYALGLLSLEKVLS